MKKNEKDNIINDEEDEDQGGTGTQTGETGFHYIDPSSLIRRDDLLPAQEINRLLLVHKELHKERVNKQKLTRKERLLLKLGHKNLVTSVYQNAALRGKAGTPSQYKTHPIAIKFSGIRDQQISLFPTDNIAETNSELKNELTNKLTNKLANQMRYQNTQRYTPKLKPY